MDKQLLDALNNLSDSLEMISKALEKKEGSNTTTTNALQSGDFSKQLTEINVSLKSIKSDTKKILEKQNTILEMQKQKDSNKKNAIDETGEDPKKQSDLKKGVTTILLIAVAVLAIGLAFKIIGKVDFLSVVSLGLAIVLIAHAFQKVAEAKITVEQAIVAGKVMVIMSIAIMLSSWILAFINPISFGQAITAILIAGMFTVIAFGIKKMILALGENIGTLMKAILFLPILLPAIALGIAASSWILAFINPISFSQAITAILIAGMFTVIAFGIKKLINALGADITTLGKAILFLPLILPAIALGIAASSWILQMIVPISFAQAITGILIAAMFTVISFGIKKLIGAFKGLDPASAAIAAVLMPLLLVAMSMAIAKSSEYLGMISPIKFDQFLTAIGISIVFVVLAFALKLMAPAIKQIKIGDVVVLPLLFTALSIAIMLSSKILAETTPIDYALLLNIVVFSVVFAISAIAMGFAAFVLAKIGISKIIEGGLCMIILAGVVAVSSLLISEGKYDNYPGWKWTLGTGLSILAFGLIATVFGLIISSGIGGAALALGAVAIVGIAVVIVATSYILSTGKYTNYPGIGWAIGVGISLTAFGLAMVGLGSVILLSAGLGMAALVAGGAAILLVAGVIVATSYIVSTGKYANYPGIGWAMGVGISLTAFGLAMAGLGSVILLSFGLGMAALVAGGEAVLLISQTIVDSAAILSKGNFKGGPTKAWAEGIALALGAFAPVYKMLSSDGIMDVLFGSGPTPEQFSEGIITVSKGIIDAARFFATSKALFEGGPSKDWAEGVGGAIAAFAPVYTALSSGGWFSVKVTPEDMKSGILTISDGIIAAAEKFGTNKSKFDLSKVPSKEWGENVGASLQAFVPIFEFMKGSGFWKSNKGAVDDMVYGISAISSAIVSVAELFASVDKKVWNSYPSDKWINGVNSSVTGFTKIVELAGDVKLNEIIKTNILALSMLGVAKTLASGNKYFSKTIDPKYMSNLFKNVKGFIEITRISGETEMAQILKTKIVTLAMLGVAKTLASGNKYFSKTIDPNYMSNLSKNVLDYVNLANSITGMGMLSGVKSLFGLDPISQAANGMVKIAGAYDKLASALKKFGGALNSIDGTKVNLIRRLTGNLAVLAALNQNAFEDMMQTLEDKASVFSKLLDIEQDEKAKRPSVGDKKEDLVAKKGGVVKPKSKYGDTTQQLDMIIGLLSKIDQSTNGVDEYISNKGTTTANAQQQNQ